MFLINNYSYFIVYRRKIAHLRSQSQTSDQNPFVVSVLSGLLLKTTY